jgi:hypothetical protein
MEIKPTTLLQGFKGVSAVFTVKFGDDIAVGGDGRVHLQQRPQPVVTIHHPELADPVAHQRNRLAPQVVQTLLLALLPEVSLTAPHLCESHAHLGGLQITHVDHHKIAVAVMIRNPVVVGQVQN